MYAQHFGLKRRPFRANASGTDVFVGPQIAGVLAGLKKALVNSDAIVTVSGPVGSGKTTIVNRALESISTNSKVIRLARMRLDCEDVLEFLLDELGVENRPNGVIQRFSLFRRRLKELEASGTRVFIAVEDASHLGTETLAELEALTAADGGDSEGASIVLMGNEELDRLLLDPQLVRVKQRTRHRYSVAPLCAAEMRGYLRHCFRLAGGDFERLFEVNAAPLLHHLSDGILRTSNNLIDSAMAAAHDQDLDKISSELLARVSENEFGLSASGFDLTSQPPVLPVLNNPEKAPAPATPPAAKPAEPPAAQPAAQVDVAPAIVFADSAPADEIPELIQDTLPDLEILAPELAAFATEPEPEPEPEPEIESQPELPAIPELALEIEDTPVANPKREPMVDEKIAAETDGNDVPAWDRDPTVAELRPDIEALEAALAFGHSEDPEPVAASPVPAPKPLPKAPEVLPEITLDHAISQRIANNLIDEPGEISAPVPEKTATLAVSEKRPAQNPPSKPTQKADVELDRIAAELAKAKSLEDVDDRMAETLFGDEINFVAAQFMTKRASEVSANDDDKISVAVKEKPVVVNMDSDSDNDSDDDSDDATDYEVTLQATRRLDDGGMDLSASQRLKTVRALNADLHPSLRETKPIAAPPAVEPESIEDQINTSMTQTLKALNVRPPVNDDDMDDSDTKRGFFSRFKRP